MRNNRKILIAGNWKEHFTTAQASMFLHKLQSSVPSHQNVEVVLFPNMMVLQPLSLQIDRRKFRLGAQDGYFEDAGAYTGEVSMSMLSGLVHYVLVGHSERRHIFNEGDDVAAKKVAAAIRNDIMPILCIGETLQERVNGETNQVLQTQINTGLINLTSREAQFATIAYEPVWAIGSGKFAKPDQVEEAIRFIRLQLTHMFGEKVADSIRVLYGGSVDNHNARAFLSIKGCDGAVVGGASVNAEKFAGIVGAAYRVQQDRIIGVS